MLIGPRRRLPVMHNISSGDDWTGAREDGVAYTADGEGGRGTNGEGKLCSIGYVVFIGKRERERCACGGQKKNEESTNY